MSIRPKRDQSWRWRCQAKIVSDDAITDDAWLLWLLLVTNLKNQSTVFCIRRMLHNLSRSNCLFWSTFLGVASLLLSTRAMATSNDNKSQSKLVYGKDDVLFGSIERYQAGRPFGKFLDAGTGIHSLRWIATLGSDELGMTEFYGITADKTMKKNVENEMKNLGVDGAIIMGNWFDETDPLDFGETKFDTILADYLIGAMDGFSPFTQDLMLPKLSALLNPGGRLYIVGLQPIPDKVKDPAGNIICRVRQVRDACILLAGHRCYREYPLDWIERQVEAMKDVKLVDSGKFPILYRHQTIVRQINVGRSKFPFFPTQELADSMAKVLDGLEEESYQATQKSVNGAITLGFDYVVCAEKVADSDNDGGGEL